MSHKIHQIGRYKGKIYKIVLRPDYSIEEVKNRENFCISLICRNPETGEDEEVVTVDDAHNYIHIDLKYIDHEFKQDKIPMEHLDYWDAYDLVMENWENFARNHERSRR
jgi:dihydroorotase